MSESEHGAWHICLIVLAIWLASWNESYHKYVKKLSKINQKLCQEWQRGRALVTVSVRVFRTKLYLNYFTLQRAQWTFRNLLTWQAKEKDKLWTTKHSSRILLQQIDFIHSQMNACNLFVQFCQLCVQENVGFLYQYICRIHVCITHCTSTTNAVMISHYLKLNPVGSRIIQYCRMF